MAEHFISQLSHLELITDKPDESLRFYRDLLGLTQVGTEGQSVYLRGWGEHFHSSIKLSEGDGAGVGHIGWRTEGADELELLAGRLDALGIGEGWIDGDQSHGRAYRFRAPGGHLHELVWDVNTYNAPPEHRSPSPDREERFYPRGIAARKLDHVTLASSDPGVDRDFFTEHLAFKYREGVLAPGTSRKQIVALMSSIPLGHNLGLIIDHSGRPNGVKHVCFWVDTREEVLRGADVFRENGVRVEQGPARHSIGDNLYLYVCEPSGLTIELYTEGYMFYPPDWAPYEWTISAETGRDLIGQMGGDMEGPPKKALEEIVKGGDRSEHGV